MTTMFDLQAATRVARKRTRDTSISVSVSKGLYNVVRAKPATKGKYEIEPIDGGDGLTIDEAIDFLLSLA